MTSCFHYGIRWYTMWITWFSLNILHADYKERYFPNLDVHKMYHMMCFAIPVMSETSNDCVTHGQFLSMSMSPNTVCKPVRNETLVHLCGYFTF